MISILVPVAAYAAGSVFDSSACNTLNIVTGTPGKVFAAFAVVATGVGFFTGKVSWGLLIGVVGGIAIIFGAPSVVSAISGKSMFACEQGVQYVSDCSGASCYSCPMGFSGEDCETCATGYEGINCDSCDDGYEGYNCSECDALSGYYSSEGYCYQACAVTFTGVSVGTVVEPTTGLETLDCDEVGFAGEIGYTCIGETFEETPGDVCGCEGNRGGINCDECLEGYDIATDCNELLSGYYVTTRGAQSDCNVSSEVITGVDTVGVNSVLPLAGILGCTVTGYDGEVDYTCEDEVFANSGACACGTGYSGAIEDCAASCDTANNYTKDLTTGECLKGCDISIPGLTSVWVEMTNVEEVKICDSQNFEGDMVYTCDPDNGGFVLVDDTCACLTGYSGSDCLTCDEANGYSDDGSGTCLDGCTIDIAGSSAIWVSPTNATLQVPCDETNYEGNIDYTCGNNSFVTTDSCICVTGFDIANDCVTCDGVNGYLDDGNGNCEAGCDITGIDSLITDSWIPENTSILACDTAADGYDRSLTVSCISNIASITSGNNSCTCSTGYTGSDCKSCDSANGYSRSGGLCVIGCYVNMSGVTANYWVNTTSSTMQLSCTDGNYTGTIDYTCDGSSFSTSDSCLCQTGYDGSDCLSCDSANNYNSVSGTCQKTCDVPTKIPDMQIPSSGYVASGSSSLTCNASTTSGINNRSSISYTCGSNNDFSPNQTTCACDEGLAGSNCDQIDTANGYVDDGSGNPVVSCDVSLSGISDTSVIFGAGNLTCDGGNYKGSIPYDCDVDRNLNESGSCGCVLGYEGTNCTSCADGYNMDGGVCKQECIITGYSGITDGTTVLSGSSSLTCESDNTEYLIYSCSNGSLTSVTNNCYVGPCIGGDTTDDTTVEGDIIHIFTTTGTATLSCSMPFTAKILVVAGGGGGGGWDSSSGGSGGGGGGVLYDATYSLEAVDYEIAVGAGGSASSGKGQGSDGLSSYLQKASDGTNDITTTGGGGGGARDGLGRSGGSGGGAGMGGGNASGGSGTASQGNRGGNGTGGGPGGGGGSSENGGDSTSYPRLGGAGGDGIPYAITNTSTYYGGGGAAGKATSWPGGGTAGSSGGQGGGGDYNNNGENAKGGGGGGALENGYTSGNGGSGIVIIRYTAP